MVKKKYISSSIMILCMLIMSVTFLVFENDFEIQQVDCYDEYNNKINELTCEKEVYPISYKFLIGGSGVLFAILILTTLYFILGDE